MLLSYRFVKLVRSKTPKVTLYTQRAKCMLMENGPNADFEAVFYDGKFRYFQNINSDINCFPISCDFCSLLIT